LIIVSDIRQKFVVRPLGATLQFLSGGRFILGLGAGWRQDEYLAYGYDFPPAHTRVEQLA